MNVKKRFGLFGVLLILASLSTMAFAQEWVGVDILEAKIDGATVDPEGMTHISIERDQEFDVRFELEAEQDVDDVEIDAKISGYEYSTSDPVSVSEGPFDMDANVTYIKKFKMTLPSDLEEDDYLLRVRITNRDGESTTVNYLINVDLPRHELKIVDALFTPAGNVEAGSALLGSVRVENVGESDEEDVKVVLSIPDFGISASDYIEEVESDDEEETEDLYIRLPECAEPGEHVVRIDVLYNNDHDQVSAASKINVLENEDCRDEVAPVVIVEEQEDKTASETVVEPVKKSSKSRIRTALEIILLVLVGLLILVGLVIGFSRMRAEE